MISILLHILDAVIRYLRADWWILAFGTGMAVVSKVYLGERMNVLFKRGSRTSILGSIGLGAFTPLCACGTMAVIISMFVTSLPWGVVMAFLVTSPLTSPTQFLFQAGVLGTPLAVASLLAALIMGLTAGYTAYLLESRTSFFKDQYRYYSGNCCSGTVDTQGLCCSSEVNDSLWQRWRIGDVIREVFELGIKRILLLFILFIAIGQLIEIFVPSQWILGLFSPDKFYSVPLAAIIGLPLYVSGTAGLPLLESFLRAGAGEGAILAFLIAGQGTSLAVIIGISAFLKGRAIAFYVAFVLFGGVISGLAYQYVVAAMFV